MGKIFTDATGARIAVALESIMSNKLVKKDPGLTLSSAVVNLRSGQSATVTATWLGGGQLTAVSDHPESVSVSVNGDKVTATRVGTVGVAAKIDVWVSSSNDYAAGDASFTVPADSISETLEEATWEDIALVGAAGLGSSYWDVGDMKSVHIEGTVGIQPVNQTLYVFIIDFNHDGVNGVYFQGFKNQHGEDIALCESSGVGSEFHSAGKRFNMNHWGTSSNHNFNYGGWKGCDLRYDILGSTETPPSGYGAQAATNRVGYDATEAAKTTPVENTLMAALPAELRAVLAPWTVYTDNVGNANTDALSVTVSVDYLPLLSEFEVQGARTYANPGEQNCQAQMAYYANGNSKIKKNNNTMSAVIWWCRSPNASNAYNFCYVTADGGALDAVACRSFGLAPAFRVA